MRHPPRDFAIAPPANGNQLPRYDSRHCRRLFGFALRSFRLRSPALHLAKLTLNAPNIPLDDSINYPILARKLSKREPNSAPDKVRHPPIWNHAFVASDVVPVLSPLECLLFEPRNPHARLTASPESGILPAPGITYRATLGGLLKWKQRATYSGNLVSMLPEKMRSIQPRHRSGSR